MSPWVLCPYERNKIGYSELWFDALFFCKILARWVYINTRMRWDDMAMRCAIVGFDALFFCQIFARWVYLNTRMRWHGDALLSEHGIPDFISFMRERNPVFWPKRGIKNRGFRALVAIVGFDALFFCKILARWVYLNTRMIPWLRRVATEWFDDLFFFKILARWVYLYTRMNLIPESIFIVFAFKRRLVPAYASLTIIRPTGVSQNSQSVCAHSFCKCLADIRPSWTGYD